MQIQHTALSAASARALCPACRGGAMTSFFHAPRMPVFCNVLWPSRSAALAAPRADIELAFCRRCHLIHNVAFDPGLTRYSGAYENSLHYSPRFQRYASALARRLIARHHLRRKDIIEVGCGDAHFLALLCRLGENRGVGFDPGYSGVGAFDLPLGRLAVIPRPYSRAHASVPAQLIVCRQVLEHIADPRAFLLELRRAVGRRPIDLFIEVPNAFYTIRRGGVWDIIYEHCSYFTPASLRAALEHAGFDVLAVRPSYRGQFIACDARVAANSAGAIRAGRALDAASVRSSRPLPSPAAESDVPALVRRFESAYRDKLEGWHSWLDAAGPAVLWGSGSKGVTFLNALGISHERISYVVDVNPRKHGHFVPGTGQQVVAPDFLASHRPAAVILLNAAYRREVRQALIAMNISAPILEA